MYLCTRQHRLQRTKEETVSEDNNALNDFLRSNEIRNRCVDPSQPFAFVCYSHDERDVGAVYRIFEELSSRGCNLWIDVANLPHDESTWKRAATDALRDSNCAYVLFFRSRNALTRLGVAHELSTAARIERLSGSILVLALDDADPEQLYTDWLNLRADFTAEQAEALQDICSAVNPHSNVVPCMVHSDAEVRQLCAALLEMPQLQDVRCAADDLDDMLLLYTMMEDAEMSQPHLTRGEVLEDPRIRAVVAALAILERQPEYLAHDKAEFTPRQIAQCAKSAGLSALDGAPPEDIVQLLEILSPWEIVSGGMDGRYRLIRY